MQLEGFVQPAEWQAHRAVWLAWPSHANLWAEALPAVQAEFTQLCHAIADAESEAPRGERLEILVPNEDAQKQAEAALIGLQARFHHIPFGDIWLRDTGPIFIRNSAGERLCVDFGFNGWGGKYDLPEDSLVAKRIAETARVQRVEAPFILEGGSVDVDGEGTVLTTEQCLLNPNRNPKMSRQDVEAGLKTYLGAEKVLWLKDGLINDHTDGHIDTLARFVAPGVVICMEAQTPDDPNRSVLEQIARDLSQMTDARGRKLEVIRVPSPGRIVNDEGEIEAASYVNFYIGNSTIVVPLYDSPFDVTAVEMIAKCFPDRRTKGVSAKAILGGGGAFHCISQQEPEGL